MLAYAVKRLLWVVPVLFGVTLVLFLLLQALPGDPARILTGDRTPTDQELVNLRVSLGIDEPLHVQYVNYLGDLLRGDLGDSYRSRRPVGTIIRETLPHSLRLAFLALVLEVAGALPAGMMAALRRDSILDRGAILISAILIAMPVFMLGLLSQLFFAIRLKWLPVAGLGDGGLQNYLLPAGVMALIAGAYLTRVVRSSFINVLGADYIEAARANGLSSRRILWVHALRNALPPVIAVAGLHFGFLIGSAVATEVVFDWPGLGYRLFTAVLARDRPVVLGATLVLVLIFLFVNLAVDLVQAWLNPKVRLEAGGARDV